ncbi:Serine threonine-kinase CTR1 [Micractinium conductrix]|uniref:Serine threonine-kinase CTR1 n=1 Tax=Micractinium conductrix TaxID=554055 RepID=A0A2P6VE84_9CHLO|nr:Serine threonine-kinase CTR1 [Micractinium conductrix]|eukprot:PSC72410.1 Serine threonine-kinase CTR1 [Micractinium conductrix]
MRRRALQQMRAEDGSGGDTAGSLGSTKLPICELNLAYRIVDLTAANFTAVVTLTNNRELELSHWQVVWRFADFQHTVLEAASGAIALSLGSPAGAPVRLVDTFTSDGVPGGGGAYSFLAEGAFTRTSLPPAANHSLDISAPNINGIQCAAAGGGASMAYADCAAPGLLAALAGSAGAAPALASSEPQLLLWEGDPYAEEFEEGLSIGGGSNGQCWSHFCCGVVLVEPWAPPLPPPSPPPPPPAEAPPPALPLPPPDTPPSLGTPSPAVQPPVQRPGNGSSNGDAVGWGGGSSGGESGGALVPPAAGGAGAGAALLLVGLGLLLHRQRRRRRRLEAARRAAGGPAGPAGPDASDSDSLSPLPEHKQLAASALPFSPRTLSSVLSPVSLAASSGSSAALATLAWTASPATGGALAAAGVTLSNHGVPAAAAAAVDPAAGGGGGGAGGSGAASVSGGVSGGGGGGGTPRSEGGVDLARDVVLHERLGSGAFGVVYRGEWRGQPVAVKVLQTTCGAASRELASFRTEARVLADLRHPNIACLLAACTVPPNICIIEELCDGGSLHQRLHGRPGARRRAPLPYRELLAVAADVAAALCYLHPRIVHRDLKPQNVLLDSEGRAKVCDFGISKYKDKTFVSTANGQAGTPAYMAPEMFDSKPITEKVDVYSFAVLLWEMNSGRVPWRQLAGPMQIIFQVGVMRQRLPLPDHCPPFLRALIEECWAEEPTARPAFPHILHRLRAEQAQLAGNDPAAAGAAAAGAAEAAPPKLA